ncbi:unnamed protein product [Pleuronectes platessa]|uniref:Uncharacterized protein n=1 Tax=Pleuronectes platessa TaxID=8262 RepID=A0A9N7YSM0_PLEPL|nr:unnamed protein product [Pleuronectes platessa]
MAVVDSVELVLAVEDASALAGEGGHVEPAESAGQARWFVLLKGRRPPVSSHPHSGFPEEFIDLNSSSLLENEEQKDSGCCRPSGIGLSNQLISTASLCVSESREWNTNSQPSADSKPKGHWLWPPTYVPVLSPPPPPPPPPSGPLTELKSACISEVHGKETSRLEESVMGQ